MIAAVAMTVSLIVLSILAFSPQVGLLLMLILKPVIDVTWSNTLFGHNALELVGTGLPVVILFRLLVTKDRSLKETPLIFIWIIYLFNNLLSLAMIGASGKWMESLEFFFRTLNGFIGFYMFQAYFSSGKVWFRRLLIALLIAGLFPMLMGAYQAITGKIWRVHMTCGLMRNIGIYHDAFSFRAYGYMTLTAILLYWSYFSENKFGRKLALMFYAAICCLVIFKVYSKAGFVIFGLWLITWTVLNKKFGWLLTAVVAIIAINTASGNRVFNDVMTTFSKEAAAIEGTGETKMVLAGRTIGWQSRWEMWKEQNIFYKLFGLGTFAGGAHNDYLRVILSSGILGLTIYLALLGAIGWKVLVNLRQQATPLNIMALMLFLMWIVDTIGLVPGLYPAYQWYVWGFVGLALSGVKGLNHELGQDLDYDLEHGLDHDEGLPCEAEEFPLKAPQMI
ncbi:MAG: hypothetical protein K6U11_08425 [bacterium]|nr:hypothetical protein [bacterium]